jgi:UDP-3-O-[3-hydroxymyristoyl] glucosamine N-acyltransferase
MTFTIDDLRASLSVPHELVGDAEGKRFSDVRPIDAAGPESLVWVNPGRADKQRLLDETAGGVVICERGLETSTATSQGKCLVVVENPKLAFIDVVDGLFGRPRLTGVHPTAVLHPEATIGRDVLIGPFTYVGKAEIGDGTALYGHCYVYDGVRIGRNVVVHAGCVIGVDGFGFERDARGRLHKFPHLGGVVIEDDVEIQALTAIDRGSLSDTVLERGSKIGSGSHVGHNAAVGEDAMLAQGVLGGSVRVGARTWLGPGVLVRDGLRIGDDSYVGLGSLVVKDLEPQASVMGSPARPLDEFKALMRTLRRLLGDS